jgi:hypothetical protein
MQDRQLITPWPLPTRQKYIRELQEGHSQASYPLEYQGRLQDFPIYEVPIDMPVYRLGNGRTLAVQQEYIVKHNVPENFFTRDPESAEALAAQDNLLRKMVIVNEANLLKYFRENIQTIPLILTQEGYVVNRKRRLCALRMLLEEDPARYKHFESLRVIFLPVSTAKQIDVLEAQLQIQPDIKADYTWVDRAMLLRDRQRTYNWNIEELARIHKLASSEVRRLIDLLDYADEYLEDRGHPREYSLVLDQRLEFAFEALQKARKKSATQEEKDVVTQLAFIQMDKPSEAGGRLYEAIPEMQENLQTVVKALAEELNLDPENHGENQTTGGGTSLVDDLLGDENIGYSKAIQGVDLQEVLTAISNPEHHTTVRTTLRDVIEAERLRKRQKKNADFSLKQITTAHTSLLNALRELSATSTLQGVEEQLSNIDSAVRQIREKYSSLKPDADH